MGRAESSALAALGSAAGSSDDPRRPDQAVEYRHSTMSEEKKFDVYSVLALMASMGSMMTKLRIYPWIGIMLTMASFASQSHGDTDIVQAAGTLVVTVISFLTCYGDVLKRLRDEYFT
eukprot:Plantae.Rhodophyta-Rhodochaete_pulchella.ctg3321.p1 GENE.Plantae.Rhodophyta-Rhodochaete_pulchella.ctg3321~~Plantae.Rhodophyta-Rhodochaete_pulchella.ctg3321.p1  ORF type:complete len:118 (+),score=17.98 Plantae.Rhodophyta-Rhodochaete_pulchella.ctg3321:44-397(+)